MHLQFSSGSRVTWLAKVFHFLVCFMSSTIIIDEGGKSCQIFANKCYICIYHCWKVFWFRVFHFWTLISKSTSKWVIAWEKCCCQLLLPSVILPVITFPSYNELLSYLKYRFGICSEEWDSFLVTLVSCKHIQNKDEKTKKASQCTITAYRR